MKKIDISENNKSLLTILLVNTIIFTIALAGIGIRVKGSNDIIKINTSCFFFARANQLFETGSYPKTDKLTFAPLSHPENYPPGQAYLSVAFYHMSQWFHEFNFEEFADRLPVGLYLFIIYLAYFLLKKIYSRFTAIMFVYLFTIIPAAGKLTSPGYFTSETFGFIFYLISIYCLIRLEEDIRFYSACAVACMTLLVLTYQLFMPLWLLVSVIAAFKARSRQLVFAYLSMLVFPLFIGHIVSVYVIQIAYSPIYMFKELLTGFEKMNTLDYAVALRRNKLHPMGFTKYCSNFTLMSLPLAVVGVLSCLRSIKDTKHLVPLAGLIIGVLLILKYIKFRFILLPFLIIICSLGAQYLFEFSREDWKAIQNAVKMGIRKAWAVLVEIFE